MVTRTEVTVNGGSVTALTRDADFFDSAGNIRSARPAEVISGSRVKSGDLAWRPLDAIDGPRDIIEERAVAALLISLRAAQATA